jgi:molybdenum cofactor guanylyltransferase
MAESPDERAPGAVGADGPAVAWAGAVLCGGASRRMGRDKALIVVDGRPLAGRVADALTDAGAADVSAIGGDRAGLTAAGLDHVPDAWPGEGPLGGVVTALRWASRAPGAADVVVVAACDLVAPAAGALRATVDALARDVDGDVAVPVVGERRQWVHAAWRVRCERLLMTQFERGERAIHAAVTGARLTVVDVAGVAADLVADADLPTDLRPPGE